MWAQSDYNPPNPGEPNVIETCKITVSADPAEAAYVSGGGKYNVTGGRVYISSSTRNTEDYTYQFQYWTLNGEIYSYSRSFYYYCNKAGEMNFVAHYTKNAVVYDPNNPAEPSGTNVKRKYFLYLQPSIEGSCSFNRESGVKYAEGSSVYLRVYPNAYYKFEGWRVNGLIISTSTSFYYTIPNAHTTIEAVMSEIPYDPANPMEPSGTGQDDVDQKDSIPGDANVDGVVNSDDIATVIWYIKNRMYDNDPDVNNDGVINSDDIAVVIYYMKN